MFGSLIQSAAAQQASADVLASIQQRLTSAPHDSLLAVEAKLDAARRAKPNAYLNYWQAYALYRLTFSYGNDRKSAEKAGNKGIALLEAIKTKSSEHYALLSLLEGIELQFANVMTLPFKAATVTSNAEKSLELGANNPRAYLALATVDFYTPKLYGGGKRVEEYLKKAIGLPAKPDPNPYAPDWGLPSAYVLLIKFYKQDDKPDQAKQYAVQGASKFPQSKALQELSQQP